MLRINQLSYRASWLYKLPVWGRQQLPVVNKHSVQVEKAVNSREIRTHNPLIENQVPFPIRPVCKLFQLGHAVIILAFRKIYSASNGGDRQK